METCGARGEFSRARPLPFYLLIRMGIGLALILAAPFAPDTGLDWPLLRASVLVSVGIATFVLYGISAALLGRFGSRPSFVAAQFAIDAVLATVTMHLSGGPRSALFFLYIINLFAAPFLVSSSRILLVAVFDAGIFACTTLLLALGWPGRFWSLSPFEVYYELVTRTFGLVLVGLLLRMLAEQVRRVTEEQSVLLDEVAAGVLYVDGNGTIRRLNHSAERMLGAVEGRRLEAVLPTHDGSWETVLTQNNERFTVLCSRSALRDGREVVLIEDITRLRTVEAELVAEERLAAVGRLAGALAHEIRNPLASVSGAAQLLGEERAGPLVDIVLREVRHINGLVEDLIDQGRPLSIAAVPAKPLEIMQEVAMAFRADLRYRDRISVQVESGEIPEVFLDPARFRQVLWNLVLNAAQAIPERGHVALRASVHGEALRVEIADDGVGIPAEALPRLFDPFFTRRVGGTGLGLATVQRIVRAHGGEITVETSAGRGSRFILAIPCRLASEAHLAG